MREISPGRHEFVVVASCKVVPIPVGVAPFRSGCREIVSDSVRREAALNLMRPQRCSSTRAHLFAFEVVELVGGDVVRERQPFHAKKHCRPDDGMKWDVVLTDEVIAAGLTVVPPKPPTVRSARS